MRKFVNSAIFFQHLLEPITLFVQTEDPTLDLLRRSY